MSESVSSCSDLEEFFRQITAETMKLPGESPDASIFTTGPISDTSFSTKENESKATNLNAKGCTPKPTRKRSRASRNAPTTLLTSDTTNFRALVQYYTGGRPTSFRPKKGPVTLSFGPESRGGQSDENLVFAALGHKNGNSQQYQQQQVYWEESSSLFSLDNTVSDGVCSGYRDVTPSVGVYDAFVMDNVLLS